jgi:hypothetical protein
MALTIEEVAQGDAGIHALRIWRSHAGSSGSIPRRDGIHTNVGAGVPGYRAKSATSIH